MRSEVDDLRLEGDGVQEIRSQGVGRGPRAAELSLGIRQIGRQGGRNARKRGFKRPGSILRTNRGYGRPGIEPHLELLEVAGSCFSRGSSPSFSIGGGFCPSSFV